MAEELGPTACVRNWSIYNGLDGVPFRTRNGAPPTIKHDDPQHKQPMTVTDMHVDQLDLSDQAHQQKLQDILSLCAKGRGYVSQMDRQYDEDIKSWRVFVIWGEFFLEDPKEANDVKRNVITY